MLLRSYEKDKTSQNVSKKYFLKCHLSFEILFGMNKKTTVLYVFFFFENMYVEEMDGRLYKWLKLLLLLLLLSSKDNLVT